jgi:hypothetical protein
MRRLLILASVLVTACATAGTSAPPPSSAVPPTPFVAPLASATLPVSEPPATATPNATSNGSGSPQPSAAATPIKTGWPTVSRSGVTMAGEADTAPPPFEGCPGPAPVLIVVVRLTGLTPGEGVSLSGTATYDFATLACGVQPSPCKGWGADTDTPAIPLCEPGYSEAAKGQVEASASATADAKGAASATLRFVIPASERACPAGGSHPWFTRSGRWVASVTNTAHGLRLVGPPDLVLGP